MKTYIICLSYLVQGQNVLFLQNPIGCKIQSKLRRCALPRRHRCIPHEAMKRHSHNGRADSSGSTACSSQTALLCLLCDILFYPIALEVVAKLKLPGSHCCQWVSYLDCCWMRSHPDLPGDNTDPASAVDQPHPKDTGPRNNSFPILLHRVFIRVEFIAQIPQPHSVLGKQNP